MQQRIMLPASREYSLGQYVKSVGDKFRLSRFFHHISHFVALFFSHFFNRNVFWFFRARKIFFVGVEKMLGYSCNAKIYDLSISDIPRMIWVREPRGIRETKNIFINWRFWTSPKTWWLTSFGSPNQFRTKNRFGLFFSKSKKYVKNESWKKKWIMFFV